MLSPQALFRGIVSRALPNFNFDNANQDVASRMWSYGENTVISMVRKTHVLADEGSYFVANNAQTAAATQSGIGFSATTPAFTVFNGNPPGGKNVYLDYVNLTAATAGSLSATLSYSAMSAVIDIGNRYSSGGTQLTPKSPNMNSNVASGATIFFGAITATAASASARTIVGERIARPPVSTTVPNVVGDQYEWNFGGVEGLPGSSITVANASIVPQALPPLMVGPQQSILLYLYLVGGSAATAPTWYPEICYWER